MIPLTLMYHAVYGGRKERARLADEDLPYALPRQRFTRHLDVLRQSGIRFVAPQEAGIAREGVLLTFDDGDAGWFRHVAPVLQERGIRALFFVTPALIGQPGYCTWDQLQQLVRVGHRIGSHGLTHRFLPDLDTLECRQELWQSRHLLERRIGVKVTTLSFPGGRFGARELRLAREAGYQQCFTSMAGRRHDGYCQPRLAVRAGTDALWLQRMAAGERLPWGWLHFVESFKSFGKYLLGNKGYHELYRLIRN